MAVVEDYRACITCGSATVRLTYKVANFVNVGVSLLHDQAYIASLVQVLCRKGLHYPYAWLANP